MTDKIQSERTGKDWWLARGFLSVEADAFQDISIASYKQSKALKRMVHARSILLAYQSKYKWTERQYINHVKKQYLRKGVSNPYGEKLLSPEVVKGKKGSFISGEHDALDFHNAFKTNPKTGQLDETPNLKKKMKDFTRAGTSKISTRGKIRDLKRDLQNLEHRLNYSKSQNERETLRNSINNINLKLYELGEK